MVAAPKESAIQRIRVGLFCIVMVLVIVSVSNMMLKRSNDELDNITVSEEPESTLIQEEDVPEDPLAEMGATPSVEPETPEEEESDILPDVDLDGPNTATVK